MTPESERKWQRARQRALGRLKNKHPGEFARMFEEEKAAEGIRTLQPIRKRGRA